MELELKFALPALDPQSLEQQLAQTGVIGRHRAARERLHNTYYDTPDQILRGNGIALRIRQLGDEANPRWVQTLKTGGAANSALSRRGEWERPVSENALDPVMLNGTPWAEFDPEGHVFQALVPIFTTSFERLSWVVTQGDARVEIALDRGTVVMNGLTTPLCELEIELLSGSTEMLFDVALDIAQHVALLPLHMSKSERAYRLAQGTLQAPLRLKPPTLTEIMNFGQVAQAILCESFLQFTANLNTFRDSEAPEVLHQSRTGWRRFKSSLKLLRQLDDSRTCPAYAALKPLLLGMAGLRDLDVAATEVFPLHAQAYQQRDAHRMSEWRALEKSVICARAEQREAVLQFLADPAVGHTLLQITRWIETGGFPAPTDGHKGKSRPVHEWVTRRMTRLAKRLDAMPRRSKDPVVQHKMRILAKRLRYGVESLRPLLPKKRAERWYRRATRQQSDIGLTRDHLQAVLLAQRLNATQGIIDFLRDAQ